MVIQEYRNFNYEVNKKNITFAKTKFVMTQLTLKNDIDDLQIHTLLYLLKSWNVEVELTRSNGDNWHRFEDVITEGLDNMSTFYKTDMHKLSKYGAKKF